MPIKWTTTKKWKIPGEVQFSKTEPGRIRKKISDKEVKKIEKINETKSWFFEKINKIDKPLARLTRKNREGSNK